MNKLKGMIQTSHTLSGKLKSDPQINVSITKTGASGKDGASAYEIWLEYGNEGTIEDFLDSLKVTDANYVHDQISSAKEWRIIHSLGKYPSVTIVDSGGNVVMGDIKYASTDEIEISFSFEFSGKAYLN